MAATTDTTHPGGPATRTELMLTAAARELAGARLCFVGIGLPNLAVNLALHTVAPGLELIYEAGVYGARPARLPLSIGDPTIVSGARAVMSMAELFGFYLQGGLIDVGFLGAAQLDRHGDINTTVIGDYAAPAVRLPGSGGANEIAAHAREVFVVMRQSRRAFVERLDFVTSPGNRPGERRGPSLVVTDLGRYRFDAAGELTLEALHPGATLEEVRATMGWEVQVSAQLGRTPPPSAEELHLLRDVLDPAGHYLR